MARKSMEALYASRRSWASSVIMQGSRVESGGVASICWAGTGTGKGERERVKRDRAGARARARSRAERGGFNGLAVGWRFASLGRGARLLHRAFQLRLDGGELGVRDAIGAERQRERLV